MFWKRAFLVANIVITRRKVIFLQFPNRHGYVGLPSLDPWREGGGGLVAFKKNVSYVYVCILWPKFLLCAAKSHLRLIVIILKSYWQKIDSDWDD